MHKIDINKTIDEILIIQTGLSDFWRNAHGWAPRDTMTLITASRLEWLPSLAQTLKHWSWQNELTDGELILAWANIGSLLEGSTKLFLTVYLMDYKKEFDLLSSIGATHKKGNRIGEIKTPDEIPLEWLIQFIERKAIFSKKDTKYMRNIQQRRNAIHAFKDKPIGSGENLYYSIEEYLIFISKLAMQLPYPDEFNSHWLKLVRRIAIRAR